MSSNLRRLKYAKNEIFDCEIPIKNKKNYSHEWKFCNICILKKEMHLGSSRCFKFNALMGLIFRSIFISMLGIGIIIIWIGHTWIELNWNEVELKSFLLNIIEFKHLHLNQNDFEGCRIEIELNWNWIELQYCLISIILS